MAEYVERSAKLLVEGTTVLEDRGMQCHIAYFHESDGTPLPNGEANAMLFSVARELAEVADECSSLLDRTFSASHPEAQRLIQRVDALRVKAGYEPQIEERKRCNS